LVITQIISEHFGGCTDLQMQTQPQHNYSVTLLRIVPTWQ